MEFQLHNFGATPSVSSTGIISLTGTGINVFLDNTGLLEIDDVRDSDGGAQCRFAISGYTNALVRVQRNIASPSMGFTGAVTCEIWNWDGTNYQNSTFPFNLTGWIFGGAILGDSAGAQTNVDVGFLNVFTSLVALNTTPPVTSERGDYTAITFDTANYNSGTGVFADLSGNGHTITWLTGQTMVATPNQSPVALVNTFNVPTALASITEAVPFRAGTNGQLDGTRSYSLADASATVTCQWQVFPPAGAPDPVWSSHTASQPTVVYPMFGDYLTPLTVTDVNGSTALTTLDVGAVATDSNLIVVDANQAFSDAVFGPQCLFGAATCNPYTYSEWANMNAMNVVGKQIGGPASGLPISDDWDNPLPGTCYMSGSSPSVVVNCTGAFNAKTVICFGGTVLPPNWATGTNYTLGNSVYALNTMTQSYFLMTLTGGTPPYTSGGSAPAWDFTLGHTTTDNLAIWTAGPQQTARQFLIAWYNDVTNSRTGRYPLSVTGCPTTTTFTLDTTSQPWPANDTTCTMGNPCTFAYSANWTSAISTASPMCYYDAGSGFEAFHRRTGITQYGTWGQQLEQICSKAPNIDQGVNFNVLPRIYTTRQLAAQQIYYPSSTNFAANQFSLRTIAGVASTHFVSPGNPAGPYSENVNGIEVDCLPYCPTDVREVGSAAMDVSAAAYVETDPTWQTTLNTYLEGAWTHVWGPLQQSDGRWDQAYGGSSPTGLVTVTNGSTAVTASGHTWASTVCGSLDYATGTMQVTNGSVSIVGTGTSWDSSMNKLFLVIYGKISGVYGKVMVTVDTVADATHMTAAEPILLDSASGLSYGIYQSVGSFQVAYGAVKTDASMNLVGFLPTLTNWYTCSYVDSTHLTLDMPFTDWTTTGGGNNFGYFSAQPVGGDSFVPTQGTQPYMPGGFPPAALRLGGLVGTANAANMLAASKALYPFLSGANAWTGSPTKGLYFSTIFANCYPLNALGICGGTTQSLREFGLETDKALADAYLSAPTSPKFTFLNNFMCAQWGNASYDSLGCDDGSFVTDSGSSFTSASPWKFAYQPFALGNVNSLPAALLGGLSPSLPRSVQVRFSLGSADHMTASVQAPTGAPPVVVTCTVSPCTISVDDRTAPGSYFLTETFYNSGGGITAQGSAQQIR